MALENIKTYGSPQQVLIMLQDEVVRAFIFIPQKESSLKKLSFFPPHSIQSAKSGT